MIKQDLCHDKTRLLSYVEGYKAIFIFFKNYLQEQKMYAVNAWGMSYLVRMKNIRKHYTSDVWHAGKPYVSLYFPKLLYSTVILFIARDRLVVDLTRVSGPYVVTT